MSDKASCSIVLAPMGRSFYLPGETISGSIKLTVTAPINIKHMKLTLLGQVIYTVRVNGTSYNLTTTRAETTNFFVQKQSLFVPVTNGIPYDKDGYHFEPNIYQWPFSMHLPENLPPSLANVGLEIPYIEYCLHVNMNRSWLHRDIRSKIPIMIGRQISRPVEVKSLERENSNFMDLRIHGQLLRNYLLIDDANITLELKIQNPSETTIKGATVKLIQRRQLPGYSGLAIIFKKHLPDIVDFQNVHLHQIFQIPVVPTIQLSAPTGNYTYPDKSNKTYSVSYVLEVKFKTGLFNKNVALQFPVFVANSEPSVEADI